MMLSQLKSVHAGLLMEDRVASDEGAPSSPHRQESGELEDTLENAVPCYQG